MRSLLLIMLALGGCGSDPASGDAAVDLALVDGPSQMTDMAGVQPDLAPYPNPIAGTGSVSEVQGGFQFTEGPLWRAAEGVLLFSDVQGNRIHKLTPPSTITSFRDPSGNANGLALDPQGLLIACEGGMKRVTRTMATGTVVSIASMNAGTALNAPNDVIVRSDGTIYFTDPNYSGNPDTQAFEGVFRLSAGGTLSTVDTTLQRPNGIALSPDEKTLYVADEPMARVLRYTVNSDGSTSAGTLFTATTGNPDGMAVDDAGNLYVATGAGIEVFSSAAAKIGTVLVPKQPANCTFGGADRRTLYITARTSLYQIRLNVPGLP